MQVLTRSWTAPATSQLGLKPEAPIAHLAAARTSARGRSSTSTSRRTASAVLCCEDYDEKYVVGDLTTSSVADVLAGPELARLRRWVYGLEEAPDDFICRKCVFAQSD